MSTKANLELRNFEWSDLDAFQELLNSVGRHGHRDWPTDASALKIGLELPRVQPERNIAIASRGSEFVGYAIVEPEPNIGRSVVGVGANLHGLAIRKDLIDWATERAAEEAGTAHLSTRDNESELEKLVDQLGWLNVRTYLKLTSTRGELAPAVLPHGYSKRPMLGLDEVSELTSLQNAAFAEHFGYSPNTDEEIKARFIAGVASIDDVIFIHDDEERPVAYCWTTVHPRGGDLVGRIGMTGVHPSARSKGLGRAIAEAGYNHLVDRNVDLFELDVDSANAPAIKVYGSLGFAESSRVNWWERSL